MKILFLIITLITFVIFYIEALIHFNIGKNISDCDSYNYASESIKHNYIYILNSTIRIHIPTYEELIKIGLIVLVFSSISGIISAGIIKYHLSD